MSEELDPRLRALSGLVSVEEEARKAESLEDLAYVMVNDSRRVLPFRQAFLWIYDDLERPQIRKASSVSELDQNAPLVGWLHKLAQWAANELRPEQPEPCTVSDVSEALAAGWEEHLAPYLLVVPLRSQDGHPVGGIFFAADTPWRDPDLLLAEYLAGAFAHAWRALSPRGLATPVRTHFKRRWKRYLVIAAVVFLLPLRQYALAPAEVIPSKPYVVTAPMEGVVEEVAIEPNETVSPGDLLFAMEATELRNKLNVAEKSFEVAQAEYLRNSQEAFRSEKSRAELARLRAVMEREKAKVEWARQQLKMSQVTSPTAGVAVFSDVSEWEGKPVSTGERIMTIADPAETRLRIKLPVADVVDGAMEDAVFYPSVSPLDSYKAHIWLSGYEATVQPDQTLAFELIARFEEGQPRLGLQGTAKIFGDRVPLIYMVLRKPLAWLRRTLGV